MLIHQRLCVCAYHLITGWSHHPGQHIQQILSFQKLQLNKNDTIVNAQISINTFLSLIHMNTLP